MPDVKPTSTANKKESPIKLWRDGTWFVFKSTYNMGELPYMIGTYLNSAILGMTSSIIIFFTKISFQVLSSPTATKAMYLAVNFYSMLSAFLIRCVYMNTITEISKNFSIKEWRNTQKIIAIKEEDMRTDSKGSYQKIIENMSNDEFDKHANARKGHAQSTVSNTEKFINSTHLFIQSTLQASVAVLSSCLALSGAHLPMIVVSVVGIGVLVGAGLHLQFNYATTAKEAYIAHKQKSTTSLQSQYTARKPQNKLNDLEENINKASEYQNKVARIDNFTNMLYRAMTDLPEYVITFITVAAFIPTFPIASINNSITIATMSLFSVPLLLAMSKSLASMVKETSAVIRQASNISECASNYKSLKENLFKDIQNYTGQSVEAGCKYFLEPLKKTSKYIMKNALENLAIGLLISTSFNLYYDSMIVSGIVGGTTMLASTFNSIALWSTGTIIAAIALPFCKKFLEGKKHVSTIYDKGNTLFSLSSSILLSQILHGSIHIVNPMASFCILFNILMPTMSFVANKYLVPSVSHIEKPSIERLHNIARAANVFKTKTNSTEHKGLKKDIKPNQKNKIQAQEWGSWLGYIMR